MITLLLSLFGLNVAEFIAICSFTAIIITGIIQANIRMNNNANKIASIEISTNKKIEAMRELTDSKIKAIGDTTDAKIRALMESNAQNAHNIEIIRLENRQDHADIRSENKDYRDEVISKLDILMQILLPLQNKQELPHKKQVKPVKLVKK